MHGLLSGLAFQWVSISSEWTCLSVLLRYYRLVPAVDLNKACSGVVLQKKKSSSTQDSHFSQHLAEMFLERLIKILYSACMNCDFSEGWAIFWECANLKLLFPGTFYVIKIFLSSNFKTFQPGMSQIKACKNLPMWEN